MLRTEKTEHLFKSDNTEVTMEVNCRFIHFIGALLLTDEIQMLEKEIAVLALAASIGRKPTRMLLEFIPDEDGSLERFEITFEDGVLDVFEHADEKQIIERAAAAIEQAAEKKL